MKLNIKAAVLIAVSLLGAEVYAQKNDVSLFGDLTSAYQSGAYPAVVEYAERMETEYPRSLLLGKTFAYKGESEYHLGRLSSAEISLDKAIRLCATDAESQLSGWFWRGKTKNALGQELEALVSYHNVCSIFKSNFEDYAPGSSKTERYYDLAILNSAEIFYRNQMTEEAIPLYEYVIENGCGYSASEFNNAMIHLLESYKDNSKWTELLDLTEAVSEWDFDSSVKGQILLLSGEACENLGQYRKAYDKYCIVLTGDDSVLASIALQKTYSVASLHQNEVGEEPGEILVNARNLSEYTGLVGEFWTRLGIDAYNAGDTRKAVSYFDNAEASGDLEFLALIGLYRSEISAKSFASSPKSAASSALETLSSYASKTALSSDSQWYLPYCCAFAKWFAMEENWNQVLVYGKEALELLPESKLNERIVFETSYWYALALYNTGDYAASVSVLEKLSLNVEQRTSTSEVKAILLKAKGCAKLNRTREAISLYEAVSVQNLLTEEDKLDYSKLLLSAGYLSSAYRLASSLSQSEANYVAGLAAFNRKDWTAAERYFTKYLSAGGTWSSYASFYNGYSQYKSGELLSAWRTLSDFAKKNPNHPLCYNARIVAANAAVQNNRYSEAAVEAEAAVKIAPSVPEYQAAVILCASIYTDSQQYDKAVATLQSSSLENTDFGIRARYQTAQIYARKGDLENCDKTFADIVTNFPESSLADESAYRRGEIYYSAGIYDQAIARFNLYLDQFKNGLFVDASSFYLGDSLAKTGQANRAIMQYLVLINRKDDSSYIYSAKKNLVQLYRQQGNYNDALSLARSILSDYGEMASKDDVPEMIEQIEMLISGIGEELINLQSDYRKAGGSSTMEGRIAGTTLAVMKWESVSSQADAVALAEELYNVQKTMGDEEAQWACETAYIIASYDRQQNYNQVAAQVFLEAASCALKAGNDELAQKSLYGAAEAFDASGLYADCQSVVERLQELYPEGLYNSQALKLLED